MCRDASVVAFLLLSSCSFRILSRHTMGKEKLRSPEKIGRTRSYILNLRVTKEEREMASTIAFLEGEAFAVLIRQWLRRRYAELTKSSAAE